MRGGSEHRQPERCESHDPDWRGQPVCDSIPEGWHWEGAGDMAGLLGARKGLALEMERDGDKMEMEMRWR